MDFNKCSRCGNFFLSSNDVCPKCSSKDNLEFDSFKTYLNEYGLNNSLESISEQTGISVKNLNRFLGYSKLENLTTNNGNEIIKDTCNNLGNSNFF